MKYKSRDYANTLVEIVIDKKDSARLVSAFLAFVKKNGDEKKLKEILKLAERLYFKKTGHKKVVIETARKISMASLGKLENELVKAGDKFENKINKDLIAGIKIVVNEEKQSDFSMAKKLQEIT